MMKIRSAGLAAISTTLVLFGQTPSPDSAATIHDLNTKVSQLTMQRRLDEAISLGKSVRERAQRELGPEDRDTLTSTNNLATAYYFAGQNEISEPLLEGLIA